jgi:dTDP-4-amino-4,6-dideoxygalactose transaminase
MGSLGCFSFFPSKNLGAFGDGGMVTCTASAVYEKLKMLRGHGQAVKWGPFIRGSLSDRDILNQVFSEMIMQQKTAPVSAITSISKSCPGV